MNISYHRFDVPASRVDYVVRLPAQPERNTQDDEPIDLLDSNRMPILNWTANQLVPIAFSIETKRYGGDVLKGEQQLGIWNAAQWEYLISKAGVDAANKLDFIPGLVVHGETWSLVITTRQHSKTVSNIFGPDQCNVLTFASRLSSPGSHLAILSHPSVYSKSSLA